MKTSASGERPCSLEAAARLPARGGSTRLRRFNGITRRTSDWDGLRKDDQLWFDGADCLVHFCNFKASQRGASLKVPYEAVEKLGCSYLVENYLHSRSPKTTDSHDDILRRPSSSSSTVSGLSIGKTTYDLFIPAPSNISRSQAYSYHLTTRNFLAYAVGAPLVGEKLSTALLELWDRLREWQLPNRLAAFTTYLEKQGYLNFAENSEHALACLRFAEDAHLTDIWKDAFVHCVGMHERLDLSPEFAGISKTTTALITRASLEMDLHIGRVVKAVGGFLEEELGPEYLGLSKAARDHLDYFRSFLHAYYVEKLGYFPPKHRTPWNKEPWAEMYRSFQNLYDYLADRDASRDLATNGGLTGGFCVAQNVQAFDKRHGYTPLLYTLPLLPQKISKQRTSFVSQKSLRSFKLGRSSSSPDLKISSNQALALAANCAQAGVMADPLVKQYRAFERQKFEGKLDSGEARKVRWLLVYCVLQMLTSIMRAPAEVRDAESSSYPVCVLTTGCPIWPSDEDSMFEDNSFTSSFHENKSLVPEALDVLEGRSSRISIHPDCEADCAEDYFASNTVSRQTSSTSLSGMAMPRLSTQLTKSSSLRSSVHALQRSVVGSLSRRNSNRRASLQESRSFDLFNEPVLENIIDLLDEDDEDGDTRPQTAVHEDNTPKAAPTNAWQEFDFGLVTANHEPTLEHAQLDYFTEEPSDFHESDGETAPSPCDSTFSAFSTSNRSSYTVDDDSPCTDLSSWDGSRRNSDSSMLQIAKPAPLQKQLSYRCSDMTLCAKPSYTNVNAGCYVPTGMRPRVRFAIAHKHSVSAESLVSSSSSVYFDESIQAADIAEEESRGRQRSRDLDNSLAYGIVKERGAGHTTWPH